MLTYSIRGVVELIFIYIIVRFVVYTGKHLGFSRLAQVKRGKWPPALPNLLTSACCGTHNAYAVRTGHTLQFPATPSSSTVSGV